MNQLRERSLDALRFHPLYRPAHLVVTVALTAGIPFYVAFKATSDYLRKRQR